MYRFPSFEVERVDHLRHAQHAQGRHVQDLGVAAAEQRGAVRLLQHADLRRERPDLGGRAPVQADALVDHALAHDLLLDLLPGGAELAHAGGAVVAELRGQVLLGLGLEGVELGLTLGLVRHDGLAQAVLGEGGDDLVDVVAEQRVGLPGLLGDADGVHELLLEVEDLADRGLGGLEPEGHVLLRGGGRPGGQQLPRVVGGLALDHQDVDLPAVVAAAGDHDVERGLLDLLERGVDDPLPVDQAHAHGGDGAVERKAGEARGHGGRVHGRDVVGVLAVHAQDRDHDLDLVAEPVLERGAQRTVDQTAREDGRLGRTTLPAEEAAGDLADRVHPLFHVDGEREEVDPLAGLAADARGEHLGVAVGDQDGAVGETRHLA